MIVSVSNENVVVSSDGNTIGPLNCPSDPNSLITLPSLLNTLIKKVLTKNLKSVGMTLAKVKEQDGMTLAKVKEQDGMTLAKVKEQDEMILAKVRHTQVSHAPR